MEAALRLWEISEELVQLDESEKLPSVRSFWNGVNNIVTIGYYLQLWTYASILYNADYYKRLFIRRPYNIYYKKEICYR